MHYLLETMIWGRKVIKYLVSCVGLCGSVCDCIGTAALGALEAVSKDEDIQTPRNFLLISRSRWFRKVK